jgi:hypothetical protein
LGKHPIRIPVMSCEQAHTSSQDEGVRPSRRLGCRGASSSPARRPQHWSSSRLVDAAPDSTALLCASQGSSKPRKLPFPSVELAPVSPLLLSGSLGYTYGRPLSTAAYPPPKCLTAARAQDDRSRSRCSIGPPQSSWREAANKAFGRVGGGSVGPIVIWTLCVIGFGPFGSGRSWAHVSVAQKI